MPLESFAISDIGLHRENNEDAWGYLPLIPFYVLADGMGGHIAGEVAAQNAVDSLLGSIKNFFSSNAPPSALEEASILLKQAIIDANGTIWKMANEDDSLQGMGTTLCCCMLFEEHLLYGHVGDSRLYRYSEKGLELLTEDHSLHNELLASGLESKILSELSIRHMLTRSLGTAPLVEPEVGCHAISKGERYFLCSDGLTDHVSHEQMHSILKNSSNLSHACNLLVDTAKSHGGTDNITIVMIEV